ncbi:MAG: hypothetical protein QOG11_637 [Solirubrobacteraceae bacterium]|jgi:hypothetical protein|nr:hypothetical protein [Solirubrobacteraceae bacterium]
MNADRAAAYGRVMHTLEELGPTKLWPGEQQQVRDAADALLFSDDAEHAREVLLGVEELSEHLVSTGRWTPERARRLVDDLGACGPLAATAP